MTPPQEIILLLDFCALERVEGNFAVVLGGMEILVGTLKSGCEIMSKFDVLFVATHEALFVRLVHKKVLFY